MKPGTASQTAVMVCVARAIAHGRTSVSKFSDPTALALLPPEAREQVERHRTGPAPTQGRPHLQYLMAERRSLMMVARTVAIDDDVRGANAPQLVILGAGLDGRAWRMPELRDAVVFEVDHPDSQRDKRARVGTLTQAARDVRFVAVDFEKDDLDAALEKAGHRSDLPTMWIWEGVVMYLRPKNVEATLSIIARRSAPGSRLSVLYHRRALISFLVGMFLRRLGEPLRSSYSPEKFAALLGRHGFSVLRDQGLPALAAELSDELGQATKALTHLRLATADKRS